VLVPGLYWADAASIGPVQARYWQLTAHLQDIVYRDAAQNNKQVKDLYTQQLYTTVNIELVDIHTKPFHTLYLTTEMSYSSQLNQPTGL